MSTRVTVTELPKCDLWPGAVNSNGYPVKGVAGRTRYVHRLAWEEANGPIPPGMEVMHVCDVRRCIELTHLKLGTHAENMADMAAKGRARPGPGRPFMKGEDPRRKTGPR